MSSDRSFQDFSRQVKVLVGDVALALEACFVVAAPATL